MPWKQVTIMSQKREFVRLAQGESVNISQLSSRYGISRKTAYELLRRYRREGDAGLVERSRRPHHTPGRTSPAIEAAVVQLRMAHPAWGGRKIRARLLSLGHVAVPATSTITDILRRHGLINPAEAVKHKAWQRFEAASPNALWQMDFKGHFPAAQGRCHPLTVLDDHSRYSLGLEACGNEQTLTVRERLTDIFRRYGMPQKMLMDNGAPWGSDREHPYTPLTVWLLRLGIRVGHSRPYHPQTLGKDERFHRTLQAELLQYCHSLDLGQCQRRFDAWRWCYNLERPHEALEMAVPASRYQQSPHSFPERLPEIEYGPGDRVRKVDQLGRISYQGRAFRIGKAFRGHYVALRATTTDGIWDIYFAQHKIGHISLRLNQKRFGEDDDSS